jgi:hypothetical protein
MVRVGNPHLIHINDLGDKSGWTVFQMIRTSSVVCHFCKNGDAFFDVFSCKDISEEATKAVIQKWFDPLFMESQKITRG